MTDERMIVVVGLLIRNGRVLLTQRAEGKEHAFMWECPGGKREQGESDVTCLQREWLEETGLVVEVASVPMGTVHFDPPATRKACSVSTYRLFEPDRTAIVKTEPGVGHGWFTAKDLRRLQVCPSLALMKPWVSNLLRISATFGDILVRNGTMRMYGVPLETLCATHLFEEHGMLHTIAAAMMMGRPLEPLMKRGLIDLSLLTTRHENVTAEMSHRGFPAGFNHDSPLYVRTPIAGKETGFLDLVSAWEYLDAKCVRCRARIRVYAASHLPLAS